MKRRRNREIVSQTVPTFETLLSRYNSGFDSRKEIIRRVKAGLPNKSTRDEKDSFKTLTQVAIAEGWVDYK